jgi:NAD+ kinase
MKRLGVVANLSYEDIHGVLARVQACAPGFGYELFYEPDLLPLVPGAVVMPSPGELDYLLTLGGDGTMLRGARAVAGHRVPVLGVNLGRLGFLTYGGLEGLEQTLELMSRGEYEARERMTLLVRAVHASGEEKARWIAVNDVVVHKGGFARVVRLRVRVNDEPIATFAADGMIVSTPTGSTAYSLSAGGPIVVPALESIVLTPISPHSLTLRPLVIPPSMKVLIDAEDMLEAGELLVTVDGQVGTTLTEQEHVTVERSEEPVILVRFPGSTFFNRLRSKLGWGE